MNFCRNSDLTRSNPCIPGCQLETKNPIHAGAQIEF